MRVQVEVYIHIFTPSTISQSLEDDEHTAHRKSIITHYWLALMCPCCQMYNFSACAFTIGLPKRDVMLMMLMTHSRAGETKEGIYEPFELHHSHRESVCNLVYPGSFVKVVWYRVGVVI